MNLSSVPVDFADPINSRILAVSEDRVQGFQRDPLGEISGQSGVELPTVIERIQAMLRVGDYRVIYEFNVDKNELYLITMGHRRDIYEQPLN